MKVDKQNALHWIYLALFGLNVLIALLLRMFVRHQGSERVLLYGHKLAGNLLPIYRQLQAQPGFRVSFLTMDPVYHRLLGQQGESSVLAISPKCIPWLARVDAVISDHGLHALSALLAASDAKFFDVWHGIPFKGFDADDFRVQHRYDETWVASPLMQQMYIERFGFEPGRVQVTGYARTDRLVRLDDDAASIKRRLGIAGATRCILFAPTWKQDARSRSLYPFDTGEQAFLDAMSVLCQRHDAMLLVRKHLNSGAQEAPACARVAYLPYAQYPDTEAILLVSDILVCDWSSIAFDYLLLDRPTIFLDVEAPFAKGLSLDPSHRFGAIAGSMEELLMLLERYLAEPARYTQAYSTKCAEIREKVYGNFADGRSAERCVARLPQRIITGESSR